jgi:hypothetical protein
MDLCNRNLGKLGQRKNHAMKFLQHGRNQFGRMYRHVDSGRKSSLSAANDHHRNFFAQFQLLQCRQQFVHHLKIDHVKRRMGESNAGKRTLQFESNAFC